MYQTICQKPVRLDHENQPIKLFVPPGSTQYDAHQVPTCNVNFNDITSCIFMSFSSTREEMALWLAVIVNPGVESKICHTNTSAETHMPAPI